MALFTKSYEELREAFVHGRFAEKICFGTEDARKKLLEQSVTDQPDLDFWHGCVVQLSNQISAGLAAEILNMYGAATITHRDLETWIKNRLTESKRGELWRFLMENGAKIYMTTNGFPIMVISTRGGAMAYFPREDGTLDWPREHLIINALLWGWKNHDNTNARDFLCDRLDTAIKTVRRAAEKDFDHAVAVSEDGKKIVHADWVFVVKKGRKRGFFFPEKIFTKEKILRAHKCTKLSYPPKSQESIIGMMWPKFAHGNKLRGYLESFLYYTPGTWRATGQGIYKAKRDSIFDIDIFITAEEFCPSPLPLGGEMIHLS